MFPLSDVMSRRPVRSRISHDFSSEQRHLRASGLTIGDGFAKKGADVRSFSRIFPFNLDRIGSSRSDNATAVCCTNCIAVSLPDNQIVICFSRGSTPRRTWREQRGPANLFVARLMGSARPVAEGAVFRYAQYKKGRGFKVDETEYLR